MFSRGTKTLLRNVIRHTDTHNRMLEEDDMWSKRLQDRKPESLNDHNSNARRGRWEDDDDDYYERRSPRRERYEDQRERDRDRRRRRRSYSRDRERYSGHRKVRSVVTSGVQSACFQVPRAHMDREQPSQSYLGREERSERWNKDAVKAEEADPDRWGHSGYKKLYPEEFISSDEEEDFWKRKYTAYYASGTGVKTKEKEKRKPQRKSSRRPRSPESRSEDSSKQTRKHRRSSSREINERRKRHSPSSSESSSPKRSRKRSKKYGSSPKKRRYRQRSRSTSSSSSSSSNSSSYSSSP